MKISKNQIKEIILKTLKENGTITAPERIKEPKISPSPTPNKKPNPLMPPKHAPKPAPKGLYKEGDAMSRIIKRYGTLKESPKKNYKIINLIREIILTETSIELLKTQFVDTGKITQEVFEDIVTASSNKSAYATWLVSKVHQGLIKDEDVYKYKDFLTTFEKNKRLFPSADINTYKDAASIRGFEQKAIEIRERDIKHTGGDLAQAKNLVSAKGIQELKQVGISFVGTVEGYQCFEVPISCRGNERAFKTYRAYLANCSGRAQGAEIKICTMAGQGHFDSYLKDGPYYVFFNLADPLSPYQFHYESHQYMNKNDHPLI